MDELLASIPATWPLWLVTIMVFIKAFRRELATFVPAAVREHFAHLAKLRADQQEHEQEMKEASAEALAQQAVSAQMQLIYVNEHLVKFITSQIDARLLDLEQSVGEVTKVLQSDVAKNEAIRTELTRIVDNAHRQETTMEAVKQLLMALVPQPEGEDEPQA